MKKISTGLALLAVIGVVPLHAAPGAGAGFSSVPGPKTAFDSAYKEGAAALAAGDFQAAEAALLRAVEDAPEHPQANYALALARIGLGKDADALAPLRTALTAQPDLIDARVALARASLRLGDREEAKEQIAALKTMKAARRKLDCGTDRFGALDKAIGDIKRAMRSKRAASDVPRAERFAYLLLETGDGANAYRLAVAAINQARYEDAIAALLEAQTHAGPHPDISNYLGFAHRKLGTFDIAMTYYEQALARDPEHRGATEYLGELYLERGDMRAAREQLAQLDRLCPFGCAEREDLMRLIDRKGSIRDAAIR